MKKRKLIIVLILILTLSVGCSKEKENPVIDSDDKKVALMYYSYLLGADAGTEYTIIIYENNDNYKYEILKNEITISGPTDREQITTGILKSKEDLNKLDEEYKNRKVKDISITNYLYSTLNENGDYLENIEELSDLLFKE